MSEHVHIRISYHNSPWRYHRCSVGFWHRLVIYLGKRRKIVDTIAELDNWHKCHCEDADDDRTGRTTPTAI